MMQIPKEYTKNGFNYKLMKRNGDVCLYKQTKIMNGQNVEAFEVHKIKIQKEKKMFLHDQLETVVFPEKERLASNEEFGSSAWSFQTEQNAYRKYNEICKQTYTNLCYTS